MDIFIQSSLLHDARLVPESYRFNLMLASKCCIFFILKAVYLIYLIIPPCPRLFMFFIDDL